MLDEAKEKQNHLHSLVDASDATRANGHRWTTECVPPARHMDHGHQNQSLALTQAREEEQLPMIAA